MVLKSCSVLSETDECESGNNYYVGCCTNRGSSEIKCPVSGTKILKLYCV